MKAAWISSFASVAALSGCGSSSPGTVGPKGNIVLEDANNYTSTSTLTVPTVQTASGADVMVCWDKITKDILCHSLDPVADIDNVSFLQIPNMSKAQVEEKLANGTLDENLVRVYRDYHVSQTPTSTCATFSNFALGTKLMPATDYVEDPTKTYMLLFATGTTPGVGARTMTFIDPTATSNVTTVAAPDGCTTEILSFHATLGQPISIPANDNTKWKVDWSQVTKDSFGKPIMFTKLDKVEVGFFEGKTAADVQAGFLDIEQSATSLYQVAVPAGARYVDIAGAKLVSDGTTAFPGFAGTTTGVWLVAVLSSSSQTPAPIVLSILEPQ